MRITADRGVLTAVLSEIDEALTVTWIRGLHTANVTLEGREVDCFTFGWERDWVTQNCFISALENYLTDLDLDNL
jgi:hypothetical protein